MKKLISQLANAEGRSEFIVAIFCDIRSFSQFSTHKEAPEIAIFIKRFYLKLTQDYFKDAVFAKPTGDGLLIVCKYNESNLSSISKTIMNACFRATREFHSMFKGDPMINFETPKSIGFGIARGTACCIFSSKEVLDYSGQLLNLAARLNDLARPEGIVLDGNYMLSVIPSELRDEFAPKRAYIRSISEAEPREVLCSKKVKLPTHALAPISNENWILDKFTKTAKEISLMAANYNHTISSEPISSEEVKISMLYKSQSIEGHLDVIQYKDFNCFKDAKGSHVKISMTEAKNALSKAKLPPEDVVTFEIQYIPKPKPKPKGSPRA